MKAFIQNKAAFLSALLIILIVLLAILGPVISPYDHTSQDLMSRLSPPSLGHLFGTDELGRDVFTRILNGTRVSLLIALVPTVLAVFVGTVSGIAGAWSGGRVDLFVMWLADVTLAFPGMLLAMVILYSFGGSVSAVVLSIVVMEWGSIARIVRSVTLSLREQEYIQASHVMGVRQSVIIIRHILPNLVPTLIVLFTLNIPASILSESSLSFLGIGVQPPEVSLGLMVNQSKSFLFQMPWLALAPAGMIMLLVLSFHFLGDALRDILDPSSAYN